MPVEDDIVKAKEELKNALGDRFHVYMENMKKWFRGKLSKQEFDYEARNIVTESYVHLHNQFLLCIIKKCHGFNTSVTTPQETELVDAKSSASAKPQSSKTKQQKINAKLNTIYRNRFVPVDAMKMIPQAQIKDNLSFDLEFCSKERSIPYLNMIHGRVLVFSLEYNIETIDRNCIFLLAEATITLLKNILSKLVQKHKFRKRNMFGKHFHYFKEKRRCTMENEMDDDELEVMEDKKELELIQNQPAFGSNQRINLYDLKNLLQTNRNLIPSHSVFTMNMEKIICNMRHESKINETVDEDAV